MTILRKNRTWIFILLGLLILIGLKQFYSILLFRVVSGSMEPTLKSGDRIVVKKNIEKIRHNDVIVFYPIGTNGNNDKISIRQYVIKRCIALPGDTIQIVQGYFHNSAFTGVLGNLRQQKMISKGIDTLMYDKREKAFQEESLNWNVRNFGPLWIPAKGTQISIDSYTGMLYKTVIEQEQKKKVYLMNQSVYINDSIIASYRFLNNYYFVAGDNLANSEDSRYWGLLPENNIIGKACFIWNSTNRISGEIRWERILRKL